MIIEISIAVIALVFLVLLIFLIPVLRDTRKTLKKVNLLLAEVQKDVHDLSEVSLDLVDNVNKLTIDLKRKSDDLNVVFQPLHHLRKEKLELAHEKKSNLEKVTELLEVLAQGVPLFIQIKERIKEYAKSR